MLFFPTYYPILVFQAFYLCTAIINTNPLSKSAEAGEWVTFSCGILCSRNDLIAWFVNGSALSTVEIDHNGLMFKTSPPHSYCSSLDGFTSVLSLKSNQPLELPMSVHCAVIYVCDWMTTNCTMRTCFSEDAYLEGN